MGTDSFMTPPSRSKSSNQISQKINLSSGNCETEERSAAVFAAQAATLLELRIVAIITVVVKAARQKVAPHREPRDPGKVEAAGFFDERWQP